MPAGAAERLRPAAPLGLVPWIQKTGIQVDGKPFDLDRVPYMRGIFEDDATEKVAEKGSQIGFTVYSMNRVLHVQTSLANVGCISCPQMKRLTHSWLID